MGKRRIALAVVVSACSLFLAARRRGWEGQSDEKRRMRRMREGRCIIDVLMALALASLIERYLL
jgi:hypothetical protein